MMDQEDYEKRFAPPVLKVFEDGICAECNKPDETPWCTVIYHCEWCDKGMCWNHACIMRGPTRHRFICVQCNLRHINLRPELSYEIIGTCAICHRTSEGTHETENGPEKDTMYACATCPNCMCWDCAYLVSDIRPCKTPLISYYVCGICHVTHPGKLGERPVDEDSWVTSLAAPI